jgi:hypothetical protein
MRVTVPNSKINFLCGRASSKSQTFQGASEKENTLSGIHLHTPRPSPFLGEYTSILVATGRKWESLLEVADSELCTASYKSDIIIKGILRLNFTAELTWLS